MPPFEPVYFSYDLLDRLIFILRYKWFFVLFLTLGLTAGLLSAVQAWRAVQMSSHNMQEKTEGMTVFFADVDRSAVEARELHKLGRHAVDTNMLFIDGLKVSAADVVGEEGRGFHILIDGLNPERILVASEGIGIGRAALDKAVKYAKERIVFGRPIGQNQAIAHPRRLHHH